jgi:hypothetical protein
MQREIEYDLNEDHISLATDSEVPEDPESLGKVSSFIKTECENPKKELEARWQSISPSLNSLEDKSAKQRVEQSQTLYSRICYFFKNLTNLSPR